MPLCGLSSARNAASIASFRRRRGRQSGWPRSVGALRARGSLRSCLRRAFCKGSAARRRARLGAAVWAWTAAAADIPRGHRGPGCGSRRLCARVHSGVRRSAPALPAVLLPGGAAARAEGEQVPVAVPARRGAPGTALPRLAPNRALSCHGTQSTPAFCAQTLCSAPIVEFIDANVLCWGGDVRHREAFQASPRSALCLVARLTLPRAVRAAEWHAAECDIPVHGAGLAQCRLKARRGRCAFAPGRVSR